MESAKVLAAEPKRTFDSAALRAVRSWRYEPLEGYRGPPQLRTVRLKFQAQ